MQAATDLADGSGLVYMLFDPSSPLEDQIRGLKAQQIAKSREADLIENELKGVRELFAKNLVQLTRLSALEREAANLDGQRGQLVASVAQADPRFKVESLVCGNDQHGGSAGVTTPPTV